MRLCNRCPGQVVSDGDEFYCLACGHRPEGYCSKPSQSGPMFDTEAPIVTGGFRAGRASAVNDRWGRSSGGQMVSTRSGKVMGG